MPFISILYYLCFLILVGLTLFVFLKNPRAWLNRYFALFASSILGWLITLYLFNRQDDTPWLLQLGRANFSFGALIVFFGYLFLRQVAGKRTHLAMALWGETVILAAIALGTGWIDHDEHIVQGQHVTIFGPLFPLYIAHLLAYIAAAFLIVFRGNDKASAKVRGQLAVIGLGMFVMAVIAVTTNVILPFIFHIFHFQEVGALSTIAFLVAITHAISVHHLFDVRLIIRRTVVFTALLAFVVMVYGVSIFLMSTFAVGGTAVLNAPLVIANLACIGIVGLSFEPLRRRLADSTDHFLYKKEYDQQEVLRSLALKLRDVLTLDEALEILMQTLVRVFHLSHAVTYVFQSGEHGEPVIKRIKQTGYHSANALLEREDRHTTSYFASHPSILHRTQLEAVLTREAASLKNPRHASQSLGLVSTFRKEHEAKEAVFQMLVRLKATIAVPLHVNHQIVGLILLSGKRSDEDYTQDDLSLLETIGSQAISSIQKAKLYEDDQMKSEFVSIASHELLTPITAIKGYLSMILDEHRGKVDKEAQGYLENVYTSANRLASLVKDLLSLSRIESGKMKFEPQSLDITKVIGDAIAQLRFTAEEKHIQLTFEPPAMKQPLPAVLADPDRTMEILMNLIGNAIKYTPKGSVTVCVYSEAKPAPHLRVEVADTGLGMSKPAQSHLFEKFYRVTTPETAGILGTGLGLFITKSMVEKMGGIIGLQSVEGKGSTFSFTLPLLEVENSTAIRADSAKS